MTPADFPDALVCAVLVLAAYRVTRLVVLDTIWGEPPETHEPEEADHSLPRSVFSGDVGASGPTYRDHGTELRAMLDRRLIADHGEPLGFWRGKLAEWIGCPFCAGVAISALVVWAWSWGEWAQWGLVVAAVAGGQAFIASRFDA